MPETREKWIPWHSSRFDAVSIPAFGYERLPYFFVPPIAGAPHPSTCGHARCEQNYFEQVFFVSGQHFVTFKAGLN